MRGQAEPGSWDDCVSQLLGPKLLGGNPDLGRRHALELAAAALRAADRRDLADDLEKSGGFML